jgi:hypothetical protein
MKSSAALALCLAILSGGFSVARADEACRPVDLYADDPSTLPGRKAWMWADDEVQMRNGRSGIGMTISYTQAGPYRWDRNEQDLLGYGEPVEIVKLDATDPSFKRMTVKRQDGREAIVPAAAVKLYEFWKCSAQQLLEIRSVPTKDGKYPFNQDVRWSSTVWVRLVDKSTPVEKYARWMKPEDVAKMDLMLCRQLFDARHKAPPGTYDLNACQAMTPNGFGPGVSLDPKAVELVSPTSMRILTGS